MKDRKEEIIRKYANGWVGGMTSGDKDRIVYPAMEQYAKECAIGFAEWQFRKGYSVCACTFGVGWINKEDGNKPFIEATFYTTEQLYQQYLKSIPQPSK